MCSLSALEHLRDRYPASADLPAMFDSAAKATGDEEFIKDLLEADSEEVAEKAKLLQTFMYPDRDDNE